MAGNLVVKYNILKEQLANEDKAKKNWERKWKTYLDYEEIFREEAKRMGWSEEEFRRRVTYRKPEAKYDRIGWEIKSSNGFPRTSSGMIGWRSTLDFSLERVGPLFISPLHTMSKEPKQNYIILG